MTPRLKGAHRTGYAMPEKTHRSPQGLPPLPGAAPPQLGLGGGRSSAPPSVCLVGGGGLKAVKKDTPAYANRLYSFKHQVALWNISFPHKNCMIRLSTVPIYLVWIQLFFFKQKKPRTSNGKLVSKRRQTSQQASCSHPGFRVLLAALFSIPEFHTFQWLLWLQRIKFSSLSVIGHWLV